MKYQTQFVSHKPAKVVLSSMEIMAQSMVFKTHIRNYKVKKNIKIVFHTLAPSLGSVYNLWVYIKQNWWTVIPADCLDEGGRAFSKQDLSFIHHSRSKTCS